MENSEIKIAFLGREFGEIVRDKLQQAGFQLVEPESDHIDLLVVGFYGRILSKSVLEKPKYGALNVHPSLLPKYRGPTPVPSTILNGDTETGVTIISMDEEVDHGPIVATQKFSIGDKKYTSEELLQILWELGGDLLVETIPSTSQFQRTNLGLFSSYLGALHCPIQIHPKSFTNPQCGKVKETM